MDEHSEYEAIVDAANIGLYQQNFAEGGFSISQVVHLDLVYFPFLFYVVLPFAYIKTYNLYES